MKWKVNKYPKHISLENIFKKVLWKKKKLTNLFNSFLYFHESTIESFLKWSINKESEFGKDGV